MKVIRSAFLWLLVLTTGGLVTVRAASVGSSGYTNSFSALPPATDWSTASLTGAAGDITSAALLDTNIQAFAAGSIAATLTDDLTEPPNFLATATWASTGFYLQTRPTGNGATLLMCTLVNTLGINASSVTISYDLGRAIPATEEVDGHRAYYSLSGAPGSWTFIPQFSTATPGRLSVNLNVAWPNNSPLYILWADDNGSGSPDTAYQIDNFSAIATPATQVPVQITSQPQDRTVTELAPVSFSVTASGTPAPTFQWYRGNTAIPGEVSSTYNIAAAALSDNNALFKVVAANTASNVSYSVTSSVAKLTVNADTTAPSLIGASGSGFNLIVAVFSERLAPGSVANVANYSITGSTGNLIISNAVLDASQTNLLLTVSTMTLGTTYTLTVNNVTDQSAAANRIANNSQAQFIAANYTLTDIGSPTIPGSVSTTVSGFDLTASGTNISGTFDQFSFNYRQLANDFDVKVRIASVSLSDTWAKAGLMARENLNTNSRYAASIATPSVAGSFFQSRVSTGAAATSAGFFPANYPYTWLRLKRVGDVFTGYAGIDGENWMQLGSVTLTTAPRPIYVGLAALSGTAAQSTTAQFRDVLDVTGGTIGTVSLPGEPLGPSTRRTGLAITEIMYKPAPRADGKILDFIEIYNSNPYWEDISGYRISGDIDYVFPENTILQGGGFLVLAKVPSHIQSVYGISNVIGPYGSNLTTSGTIRLRNKEDAIFLEIPYSNHAPWPVGADGTGHSLVLARPSHGEGHPDAWAISDTVGGSPGRQDGFGGGPLRSVVINEFLANSAFPAVDFIELYNHANQAVDISGCTLSDDPHTNKFTIPNNTVIPARGFAVFDQTQLGFGLSAGGEVIYFRSADNTRVLDAVEFGPQGEGVSSGRSPDGAADFYPLTSPTPGATNSGIRIDDIVINEIMYRPLSGNDDDEYVELYNKGTSAVNLGGWRFVAGIDYKFPSNAVLGADHYLVVAKSVTNLLAHYPNLNTTNTFGDYDGSLGNKGERLALGRPQLNITTNMMGEVETNTVYVAVDEVTYATGGNWGNWANEGGSSLELIDPRSNHRLAHNWADSDESAKAPWTTVSGTGLMEQGAGTANFIELFALGEGEYLVDNVEVINSSQANMVTPANSTLDANIGAWAGRGTHIRSSWNANQGIGGTGCLQVRASARGDSLGNRALCTITVPTGVVTLRAQVRWLKGFPEFLLRLHGNWMEAFGRLQVPTNLGTPGARNSQAVSNGPPAIYEVTHTPVLPAANEPAVVTARVHDPDGVSSLTLRYRVDTTNISTYTYTSVPMLDNGTGGDAIAGDGVFSATIPPPPAATPMVAFQVIATDSRGAVRLFPLQIPGNYSLPFECLVRFGDPILTSAFGIYRQWFTTNAVSTWINRPALSNEKIYGTFVYGNTRVIYNISTKYSSSPYHQGQHTSPVTGSVHYAIDMPLDDQCLGTENWNKVHAPGNSAFDENTNQREQIGYWFARQMGLPYNYRRYVQMIVNGNKKGTSAQLMEDTERGGDDIVTAYFPNDSNGPLYKIQPWFEVDDGTALTLGFVNNNWCTLNRYPTASNSAVPFPPKYRNNWLVRAVGDTANDFSAVYDLVDAANTPGSANNWAAHTAAMEKVADIENWMRTFSVSHSVGDWDHFGTQNSQNMYGYKPEHGKFTLMLWDVNILMGNSGSWTPGQNLFVVNAADTRMPFLYSANPPGSNPKFRRAFLRGLKEMAGRHMQANSVEPVIDARQGALLASGVNVPAANVTALKTWISQARVSILTQIAPEDATNFVLSVTNNITTANNLITITGDMPLEAKTILINGIEYPVIWVTAKSFKIQLAVQVPLTVLNLTAFDVHGQPLPNFTTNITVNYTGPVPDPAETVVFTEIMYNPTNSGASYVEIYNRSSFAFDLSGWKVNGLDYTFPFGAVIAGNQTLALAKNLAAFGAAYGTNAIVFAQFDGNLDPDGETLTLLKPGADDEDPDLVIDKVRYESRLPWPTAANGAGPSLQLIDPNQDNSRPSNWTDRQGWRFFSYTSLMGANATNLQIYLASAGDVYIDSVSLVTGSVAGVGDNQVDNGGFESGVLGSWIPRGNHASSSVSSAVAYEGNYSLHITSTGAGTTGNLIDHAIPLLTSGTNYTLSFWYLPSTNGNGMHFRVISSYRSLSPVDYRPVFFTPGTPNSVSGVLPAYDPLWLNELQPQNLTGPTDNQGEREPWIELYNAGTTPIDLSTYYLANNYDTNLTQWQFPAGASIDPGQFKIVWADGQPGQTAGSALHTSFRLNATTGSVALVRLVNARPQITDYLTYSGIGPDLSYGDFPNGQPFERQTFFGPTPGAANNGREVNVFINEWMAANTNTLADPADGHYDDWFEIYNPGSTAVDLSGYWLTDNLNTPKGYQIPTNGQYVIPAGGFLLVWADNQPEQNTPERIDLHAAFQLSKDGETIGLFAPNGSTLIDGVTFGPQTNNISEGRFADGAAARYFMTTPTPRAPNTLEGAGSPPVIDPITDRIVTLGQTVNFTVTASDADLPPQTLTFSLDAGFPAGAAINPSSGLFTWTPSPAQAPSANVITVRVTDNGAPPLSSTRAFNVNVRTPPRATILNDGSGHITIGFATIAGRMYQVEYKDNLNSANWTALGAAIQANGATLTVNDNIAGHAQRFYRIVQLD